MSLLHPHRTTQDVGTEPEIDELSDRVLALISAYEVRTALDALAVYPQAQTPSTEAGAPHHEGFIKDGIYHAPE